MFPIFAGNSASTGYNLTRSLRFRASASGYLNRTPSVAGNRQTWTWSGWVKRGTLTGDQAIFFAGTAGNNNTLRFNSDNTMYVFRYDGSITWGLNTTQVFRDPSAWYHIVVAYDSTQATSTNRVKLYINGTQVTAFSSATYPSLNLNSDVNNTVDHRIANNNASNNFDGYQTEDVLVDGQALTPTSFGSTNALTGVWQAARYTGSYGTNGFYLPFTDNSALTTASNAGLGKDFSGNGNYWTTNNISITAGVTYDSMTDVPTLTSATAANFATLNPLQLPSATLSNGNLTASGGSAFSISTIGMSSGKFYAEMTVTTVGGESSCGISQGGYTTQTGTAVGTTLNGGATAYGYLNDGSKFSNGVNPAYGSSYTSGDVIGIAFDATAGTLTFYKNNTSQGSAYTGLTSGPYFFAVEGRAAGGTNNVSINFGQRPFSYTPPTGHLALNTYNLPTSTIVKGNTVMDATLYTGAGNTSSSITNAAGFKPDLVWSKARSIGYSNYLYDSVRGTGTTKSLVSNGTGAEGADASNANLSSFDSTGWTIGTTSGTNALNASGQTFVGWQWQAGQGSSSSNTNGTITSTVSVNASAGFSVVTYTGNGTTGATIGHGLGVAPQMIIVKNRGTAGTNWQFGSSYNNATSPWNYYLRLNTTAAAAAASTIWNNTAPSSSVFTVGTDNEVNFSANTYVAYCWTPIAGYSAFGSYTGNGSTDGTFVYTGFRTRFLIIKRTDSASALGWFMYDTATSTYNFTRSALIANSSASEQTPLTEGSGGAIDIVSNGFKPRGTYADINASGATYIYAAFAENPFKNSLAR